MDLRSFDQFYSECCWRFINGTVLQNSLHLYLLCPTFPFLILQCKCSAFRKPLAFELVSFGIGWIWLLRGFVIRCRQFGHMTSGPRLVHGDENEPTITDLVLAVAMAPALPFSRSSQRFEASVFSLSFCLPNDFLRFI